MTLEDEILTPKEPTIEDHIAKAKELTIPQVSVREEAFTELVKAVEKMNDSLNTFFNQYLNEDSAGGGVFKETNEERIQRETQEDAEQPDYRPTGNDI